MVDIEFIVIGNELLNGRIRDINTYWLARYFSKNCLFLGRVTMVSDDETEIREAIDRAWGRSQIIITSGGLGPTEDDITKKVLAQTFDKEINFSDQAIEVVTKNYANFEKIPQLTREGYAHIPDDFIPILNPVGLAPGLLYFDVAEKKLIFSAPGVPYEFQHMIESELPTYLKKFTHDDEMKQELLTVRTRNIPEEKIFFDLCPELWDELSEFGIVSSLPHPLGVDIVVSYQYQNKKEAEKITRGIMACFDKSALKPAIWHVGSEDLTEVIIKKASIKNLTLATAESCTGGLISAALTDIPGSSKIYVGSVVSYANEVKSNILNVKNSTIEQFGAVSEEVATEMAKGMRDLTKVDLAISTTGIAGPAGGSKEKPVGSVCFGVSSARGTFSQSFRFRGDRETLRTRFTSMALYLLLEEIDRL